MIWSILGFAPPRAKPPSGTGENIVPNSSISIAAAIAAYSRMIKYEHKINNKDHIYYSDTDSLILDKPLDDYLVGKDLGKFDLEF